METHTRTCVNVGMALGWVLTRETAKIVAASFLQA